MHRQVPVKVNAFCDEGIAELVSVLSEVPGLVTIESCQGGGKRYAFVCFRMASWRELSEFVFEKLMPAISDDFDGLEARVRIDAHRREDAVAWIDVHPTAIARFGAHIRATLIERRQAPVAGGADDHAVL